MKGSIAQDNRLKSESYFL